MSRLSSPNQAKVLPAAGWGENRVYLRTSKSHLKSVLILISLYLFVSSLSLVLVFFFMGNSVLKSILEALLLIFSISLVAGLFHTLLILPFRTLFIDDQNLGEHLFSRGEFKEKLVTRNKISRLVLEKDYLYFANSTGLVLHATPAKYWEIHDIQLLSSHLATSQVSSKGIWT